MKSADKADLLNGSLWDKILMFALPLSASNILQQFFNSADMAVVGQFAGKAALAAVGSNSSIINLLINMFVGLSIGANVVIARNLGSGDTEKASRASHTAISISVLCGLFVMVVGVLIARPMLEFMSSPEDVIDLATIYLRIYFLGMPFIMIYNFGSAILRSIGDTRRPFMCLLISGIINIVLNLFFVIVCHLSVAGVAIATVLSNVVSASMVMYFLIREKGAVKIERKQLCVDRECIWDMMSVGIPAGLQSTIFSFSNISVQSTLNSLGSDVVAGSAAALNFESFVHHLFNGFAHACVTFTSQNYGAQKFERCRKSIRACMVQSVAATLLLSGIFLCLRQHIIKFYITDPDVLPYGIARMEILLSTIVINTFNNTLSGALRGMGKSMRRQFCP